MEARNSRTYGEFDAAQEVESESTRRKVGMLSKYPCTRRRKGTDLNVQLCNGWVFAIGKNEWRGEGSKSGAEQLQKESAESAMQKG